MRQKIVKISITFSDCLLTNTYNSDAFLPFEAAKYRTSPRVALMKTDV